VASKKDLLEAQSFSRKRLLTAFVAGAPGGKELEPSNPFRTVIAGIALAVMVVIGSLFYGLLQPGLPKTWENGALILVTDTGERYFTKGGTLYPVINATSARLLGTGSELTVVTTKAKSLADIPLGPAIGIVGAPDDVPAAQNLVAAGWTACLVADAKTAVSLPGATGAATTDDAVLVAVGTSLHVVYGDTQYPVAAADEDRVVRAVGLAGQAPREVDSRWLNLFTQGPVLEPLAVEGAGDPAPGTDLAVGSLVAPGASDARFVVMPDGGLASLTPLAYELARLNPELPEATESDSDAAARELPASASQASPAEWPADVLTPIAAGEGVCAQFEHGTADGLPQTLLVTAPTDALTAGVAVALRGGALVSAGGAGSQSERIVYLVDENGTYFPIPDASDALLGRLGYAASDVSLATTAWLAFFGTGPELTQEAAGATPDGANVTPAVAPSASPSPVPTLEGFAAAVVPCTAGPMEYSAETPEAFDSLQHDLASAIASGAGVTVAIVDSGIDGSHPQLAGAIVGGINLVPDGTDATGLVDNVGHGTAVAGIIAAQPHEGSGLVGLAPGARLLSVRVVGGTDQEALDNGFGPDTSRLAQGIRWAADNGASIINVSVSLSEDDAELREAVAHAQARGALIVAASGNRTDEATARTADLYPASYPGVLATTAVNGLGVPTDATYVSEHIAIAAPGQAVLTTHIGGGNCTIADSAPATSFATAYVSAAAALVEEAHANDTADQVAYRLTATATRLDRDAAGERTGWGVVQPFDAMNLVPGAAERGPDNPFTGSAAVPVEATSVQLAAVHEDRSAQAQRTALQVLAVLSATGLALLGAFAVRRTRALAAPTERQEPQRDGLLDRGNADLRSAGR